MSLLLHQFRAEQRLFWRGSREFAFFTFLLPIVFFLILGSAYGDEEIEGADGYLLPSDDRLRRRGDRVRGLGPAARDPRESGVPGLRATPLPGWAYITAVLGSIVFVFFLEAISFVALSAGSRSTWHSRTTWSPRLSRSPSAPSPSRRSVSG